jgi:hypothetical protein
MPEASKYLQAERLEMSDEQQPRLVHDQPAAGYGYNPEPVRLRRPSAARDEEQSLRNPA